MTATIATLFALLAQPAARAYVPPSFFIVRMLARKHAPVETARFRHKISFHRKSGELVRALNETLVVTDGESASVRLTDESGSLVGARTRNLVGSKGENVDRPATYALLYIKDGATIFDHFKALGLPLKTEADLYSEKEGTMPYKPESTIALHRADQRVAVVLADNVQRAALNGRVSQLWVEKDSFLPLKAVLPGMPSTGMASEYVEYRFAGFQVYKSLLYPKTMEVHRDGSLWAKVETIEVKLGEGAHGDKDAGTPKPVSDGGELNEYVSAYFRFVR